MWSLNSRDELWSQLNHDWDVIVVGGGITGAGVLSLAVRAGLKALLLERRDFSWGTSSRSTKLVHGGLRYLAQRQFSVTRDSVGERERLTRELPGLVERIGFLMPIRRGAGPKRGSLAAGLAVYDAFAGRWDHEYVPTSALLNQVPFLGQASLAGGFRYTDSVTDDARLVLRIILEAVASGGQALNYVAAEELLLGPDGHVAGVRARDMVTGRTSMLKAKTVINACGVWADSLRAQVGGAARLRPSRGSHLVFPAWRLPAAQAVTLVHPQDGRPVFVLPWEGAALAGTTDLDHSQSLDEEPRMASEETDYILQALNAHLAGLQLSPTDALCSFAGVRPIVGTGKGDPAKESRAHVVLEEHGLVTVVGGKLTTFRLMALDALAKTTRIFPQLSGSLSDLPVLESLPAVSAQGRHREREWLRRLQGRYGSAAGALLSAAEPGDFLPIEGTQSRWAELRWSARREAVVHLEDLMLRRVRLGLLLPRGGLPILDRIRGVVQQELGWDDRQWNLEADAYAATWEAAYSVPS